MAKLSRLEVYEVMKSTGLVPLFSHTDIDVAKSLIDACYKGGARVLEFTARAQNAHTVFEEMAGYVKKEYPDLALGIGSITDGPSASLYIQLGADFIVTPVFREDIAIICNRRKIPFFPGCGSLTEIARAEEIGCEIVKLFPGSIYGPEFIKAIKGPQPWTSIMPTGGVEPTGESIEQWLKAGASCVGIGSKLMIKDSNGDFDYDEIQQVVKKCVEIIKDYKSK
ncbi:bifunctional 4-hydroxy-2-oxoglutarate aldolase/2-dehydro-3-deoxy-phosphogluconate aldolase [Christiangramia forsetii]|uniref:KHG/KDPG aldolase n=2 Tax=Christiangramia forsetii TaxID=411153 RepID=A0M0J1_CHRFK|nr:bifunctional 4-hydroxy-2-oxoglutarate aldolase/2-dehydro-3-deoxy-phosphogluconate aldolase [Christiangramia forsetii]GGG40774.1 bifunctional 4-hydroxy-2-oxoglutarate aldolase/2-dehydro-3-deoxy-phosphogluconate aldolase [Christiangramia forsetii]CAL66136.1 KHG/KDPG aldolase [Christiangramia forsetii KT0803]